MKTTIGKLFLSLAMAIQPVAYAADPVPQTAPKAEAPPQAVKTADPIVIGVRAFNMIQGGKRLFLAMKAGANASDEEYLDRMAEQYKDERLPLATAKNGAIWLQGLSQPIKVVDLKKSLFSYNGITFDLTMKDGIEKSLEEIDKIIFPKSARWLSWFLPEANASVNTGMIVAGTAAVGGLAVAAFSCFDGPNKSELACGLGAFLGGAGLGYIIASLLMGDRNSPPTGMSCYPGGQGCSQIQLSGVNTISQCPGQGYSYNPALRQVPPAQGQYFAQQLAALCPYPGTMGAINAAYAAPVPRFASTAPIYQRQVPGVLPYNAFSAASKKPAANGMKAATVTPLAAPKKQTPAVPSAGAAK